MICPICNGEGVIRNSNGVIIRECRVCDGKGIVQRVDKPMTNKEYYTETDEELAGFLSRTCQDLLASVVEDGGSVPNEYIEEDREFWLKWLKEKHE